jgi:hypothetical protein
MLRAESRTRLRVMRLKKVDQKKTDVKTSTIASVDERRKAA